MMRWAVIIFISACITARAGLVEWFVPTNYAVTVDFPPPAHHWKMMPPRVHIEYSPDESGDRWFRLAHGVPSQPGHNAYIVNLPCDPDYLSASGRVRVQKIQYADMTIPWSTNEPPWQVAGGTGTVAVSGIYLLDPQPGDAFTNGVERAVSFVAAGNGPFLLLSKTRNRQTFDQVAILPVLSVPSTNYAAVTISGPPGRIWLKISDLADHTLLHLAGPYHVKELNP